MCQYEQPPRMHSFMMKYFQKMSCVHVALYLLNNEPTGCWHREENKKGD